MALAAGEELRAAPAAAELPPALKGRRRAAEAPAPWRRKDGGADTVADAADEEADDMLKADPATAAKRAWEECLPLPRRESSSTID